MSNPQIRTRVLLIDDHAILRQGFRSGWRVIRKASEVQDTSGRWHSLRVRPYVTLDNKVEGAVLVLMDIERA